ncbi:hypothetical protein BAUCODRAFT_34179 [Baudoinia panamericana UAMH 10762]|uniref:Uncharacterized protein n=1 Tax=Baudoinia panamericana (strain UAMH 10762) TaxID=717646 RepID=M2NCY0_BAUPA|nr:uncharacterized protein BAUCODRAFT_34179 [Baudoinia panamericana UAMH 10762]EMC96785.1 hypothetical protein BAUCODRAFT_34179 [Baudoinia panamericana UAMH 10762]
MNRKADLDKPYVIPENGFAQSAPVEPKDHRICFAEVFPGPSQYRRQTWRRS